MTASVAFGLLFAAGLTGAALALTGADPKQPPDGGSDRLRWLQTLRLAFTVRSATSRPQKRIRSERRELGTVGAAQLLGAAAGLLAGWWATQLFGMSVLLAGLGVLLPPFMSAPRRRRRQMRVALAWQQWSRQLAELARSGAGLADALRGSVDHAPPELKDTVARAAATAELRGLEEAFDELFDSGPVWEPEVAAGLRMAATSGGAVADPLLNLCQRIGDVVDLHRTKTEAVVQLWTQTIALLGLAGGVVLLMYRNNPAYFEPYRTSTGQSVFVLISAVLLIAVAFLVHHSVVREPRSVLVLPRRRRRGRDPI